jgi:4-aminobutyrate aminotransferase-like enzyme
MDETNKEQTTSDLIKKIIELDNWIAEKRRKAKPAIIIDSKGNYVDSMYGATYLDYLQAKKQGRIKI